MTDRVGLEREGWDVPAEMQLVRKDGEVAGTRVLVWATHSFPGFHWWAEAPAERNYLGLRHRHLFKVRVEVEVLHDNRDVEFHDLYDVMVEECARLAEAGGMSCEMLARHVREAVLVRWPGRYVTADVSEDGEFGAMVLPSDAS